MQKVLLAILLALVPLVAEAQTPTPGPVTNVRALRWKDASGNAVLTINGPSAATTPRQCTLTANAALPLDACVSAPTPASTATPQPTATPIPPAGASGNLQTNNGSGGLGAYAGSACPTPGMVISTDASGAHTCATPVPPTPVPTATPGSVTGYQTIQEEGSNLTQRGTVNFIGSGMTCADNAGATKTDCTIDTSSITSASARVYNSAAFTTTTGTGLFLTFDSERFDTNALHDTVSNTDRLTAPVTGLYLIYATVSWAFHATGYRTIALQVNGTTNIGQVRHSAATTNSVSTRQTIATVYSMTAGDYVRISATQDSPGNLNVEASAAASPEFGMSLLAGQ